MPSPPEHGVGLGRIASYSCTSWSTGLRVLREVDGDICVALVQDHDILDGAGLASAAVSAGQAGCSLVIEPAIASAGAKTAVR